ncbi:MAG TPA: class I SAM-dependent methyltransferase [Alphaproteobacteria bacterium]|nr:class I SAM-dependent methyltransferase [Alphaproteobacteria bacterium]
MAEGKATEGAQGQGHERGWLLSNGLSAHAKGIKLPPPWTDVGRHEMFPEGRHDEIARFNFLASLNQHLATSVFPGNRLAYETRVKPAFVAEKGRPPETRQEVRKAMSRDGFYRFWSALRRSYMEMRQENGRAMVLRQADDLIEKARRLNDGAPTLELDPSVEMPRYVTAVDIHCMPGGYHSEIKPGDVSGPANYDTGIFATTGGLLGRFNDGGGRAIVDWLERHEPSFRPRRILDLGAGLGHNTLPLARKFPEAEVWAIDAAAPMLRYGHARAKSMGITNVHFAQINAERLRFEDDSFDFVVTAQFWHETSVVALRRIMKELYRVLAPGGLTLSLEQPPYRGMDPFEAFIRDWDSHNNNEPFWTTLHDMNMMDELERAGFDRADILETRFPPILEPDYAGESGSKDFGRGAGWYGFGGWKR